MDNARVTGTVSDKENSSFSIITTSFLLSRNVCQAHLLCDDLILKVFMCLLMTQPSIYSLQKETCKSYFQSIRQLINHTLCQLTDPHMAPKFASSDYHYLSYSTSALDSLLRRLMQYLLVSLI